MRAVSFGKNISAERISALTRIIRSIFEYGIAAVLLIQCNTVWMTVDSLKDDLDDQLHAMLLICVVGAMVLSEHRYPTKRVLIGGAIIAVMSLYMWGVYDGIKTNQDVFLEFAYIFIVLAAYCLICCNDGVPEVLFKYKRLVCAVAVFSLIMWLLCTVLELIPPTGEEWSAWHNVYITCWDDIYFETQGMRNTSIFIEGPMAALHYSLALLTEAFLTKKPRIENTVILILALLSTMTTTGCLVILFVALARIIALIHRKGWLKKRAVKISIIVIAAAGLVTAIAILIWKMDTVSGSMRFDDLHAGWMAFLDDPIYGNGCNNLPAIQQYMSEWRQFNMGYSSGLMWILSDGGILLGAIYLSPIICATVKGIKYKQWGVSIFSVCLLGIFFITVFQYSYILSFLSVLLLLWRPEQSAKTEDPDEISSEEI